MSLRDKEWIDRRFPSPVDGITVRNDFEVGKWYKNPMWEQITESKFKYVRIGSLERRFSECNTFVFDMGIDAQGNFKTGNWTQNNGAFEIDMRLATEKELKWIEGRVKYGKFGL